MNEPGNTDPRPDAGAPARRRVLVTVRDEYVSPRFDLTGEVVMVDVAGDGAASSRRTVVLPEASAEALCHLVISHGVDEVVCGAIEEEYYQYLTWKRVKVVDSVVAGWEEALVAQREGRLESGDVLIRPVEGD